MEDFCLVHFTPESRPVFSLFMEFEVCFVNTFRCSVIVPKSGKGPDAESTFNLTDLVEAGEAIDNVNAKARDKEIIALGQQHLTLARKPIEVGKGPVG